MLKMYVPYCLTEWYYTQLAFIHIPTHYMNIHSFLSSLWWVFLFPLVCSFFFFRWSCLSLSRQFVRLCGFCLLLCRCKYRWCGGCCCCCLPHAAKGNWWSLFCNAMRERRRRRHRCCRSIGQNFVYKSMEISANCISHISVLQTVLQTVQHRSSYTR